MAQNLDDLDAVRTIVTSLASFDANEQERIIRWAKEKLGLSTDPSNKPQANEPNGGKTSGGPEQNRVPSNIKEFITAKSPQTDNQLAATVAYFYRFEAPENDQKTTITKDDLQNACRLAGIDRLQRPEQTLVNAHHAGLLDKGSEKGSYMINSVGENLVAMTLPSSKAAPRKAAKKASRKKAVTKGVRSKAVKPNNK